MNPNLGSSLYLGTYLGIPIKVHWSFGLLILFIIYILQDSASTLSQSLWFFSIIFVMFVFVVLHEYGHALMARKYNVQTRDIIISPIGGVARLESIPKIAKHELHIALAGPAVNVVLATIFVLLQTILGHHLLPQSETINLIKAPGDYIGILLSINLALIFFNMIPAFPMDGGRVLRAILSMTMKDHWKATKYASYIGQIFAIAFVLYGLYLNHYVLLLIGLFVFLTARSERRQVNQETLMKKTQVKDLMRTNNFSISLDQMVKDLSKDQSYLIIEDDNVIGCLPNIFIRDTQSTNAVLTTAKQLISQSYGHLNEDMTLDAAYNAMNAYGWVLGIVMDQEQKIKGVIDRPLLLSFSRKF